MRWPKLGGAHAWEGFLYDLGQAEVRSSIRASQPSQAEEAFLYKLGRAEGREPGYQTAQKWVCRVGERFSGGNRATKHALKPSILDVRIMI